MSSDSDAHTQIQGTIHLPPFILHVNSCILLFICNTRYVSFNAILHAQDIKSLLSSTMRSVMDTIFCLQH